MPEAREQTVDPDALFGVLNRLCRDYVAADLRLLSDSMHRLRTPGIVDVPVLLTSPALNAHLAFDITVSETKKILFGLIRRDRSERVAELDVQLTVTPAPDVTSSEAHKPAIYGTSPEFIEAVDRRGNMTVLLAGGERISLRFSGGSGLASATVAGGGAAPASFEELPPQIMASMLVTLATWVRAPGGSSPEPLRERPEAMLETLLDTLATGVEALLRDTADVFRPVSPSGSPGTGPANIGPEIAACRDHIASMLGPEYTGYRLAALSSRLKLLLTDDGELSTDPFADTAQRYNIEARLDTAAAPPRVVVALKVPDLLVSGTLHDRFLELLSRADVIDDLMPDLADVSHPGPVVQRADVAAYMRSARSSKNGIVARMNRTRSGKDEDLILLHGTLGGRDATLLIRIAVTFRTRDAGADELRVKKVHHVSLVAARFGEDRWRTANGLNRDDTTRKYFYRAFASLYRWRLRFEPEGAR